MSVTKFPIPRVPDVTLVTVRVELASAMLATTTAVVVTPVIEVPSALDGISGAF